MTKWPLRMMHLSLWAISLAMPSIIICYIFFIKIGPAVSKSAMQVIGKSSLLSNTNINNLLSLDERTVGLTLSAPTNNYGFSAGELVWANALQQEQELRGIKATGGSWVRIDMEWYIVQPSNPDTYDWSAYDHIIDAIDQYGLKALVVLDYAPVWAATSNCSPTPSHKCAPGPGSNQAFARFAAAAAVRYTPHGVTSWEIWNEPNTLRFWYPSVSATGYANLLKATYPAIKKVNPTATVITAGLSSAANEYTVTPSEYMANLYAEGTQPYFDALGAHPYSYPLLPSINTDRSGWTQMLRIHDIAAANGDATKKIWVTEVGAPTGGPHSISENTQAKFAEEIMRFHTTDSWLGPLFWYDYQDLGTNPYVSQNFFGLIRADGSYKPAYTSFLQAVK